MKKDTSNDMKLLNVNVDLMQVFVTIKKGGIMINAEVNVKKWIGKGICNKKFICNPSNCECEYDKSCDVGKYLDYENCKCRARLTDKLVEESSENELIYNNTLNDHKKVCNTCERSSCTIYIASLSVFLTMNIEVGTVFIYFHRYSKNEVITNINHSTEKTIYWMQIH